MVEVTLKNYLTNKLSVPVLMEKPTGSLTEFVLLEKTASSRDNNINSSTFAIQSWSDSMYNASSLNEAVKEAMIGDGTTNYGIVSVEDISKCSLNSDYNYTDTTTKSYRYQAVFDLVY